MAESPETIRRALIELAAQLLKESAQLREMAQVAILESRRMRDEMRPADHLRLIDGGGSSAAAGPSSAVK